MGLDDRDYMRNRERSARPSGRAPNSGWWHASGHRHDANSHWGILSQFAVVVIAAMAVFAVAKYVLERRNALPFPPTGDVHWYSSELGPRTARLTLRAPMDSGRHFSVFLDDWSTGAAVAMIPVRSGESAVTLMPLGRYRMTIAKGTVWLGPHRRFGFSGDERTVVDAVEFYQRGNRTFGHVIDLEVPFRGNLDTGPSFHR